MSLHNNAILELCIKILALGRGRFYINYHNQILQSSWAQTSTRHINKHSRCTIQFTSHSPVEPDSAKVIEQPHQSLIQLLVTHSLDSATLTSSASQKCIQFRNKTHHGRTTLPKSNTDLSSAWCNTSASSATVIKAAWICVPAQAVDLCKCLNANHLTSSSDKSQQNCCSRRSLSTMNNYYLPIIRRLPSGSILPMSPVANHLFPSASWKSSAVFSGFLQ